MAIFDINPQSAGNKKWLAFATNIEPGQPVVIHTFWPSSIPLASQLAILKIYNEVLKKQKMDKPI